MQIDSWIFLFLNLTILLAMTWFSITLLKSSLNKISSEYISNSFNQVTLRSLFLIRFKRHLVIRRMQRDENDNDPPYLSSLVL